MTIRDVIKNPYILFKHFAAKGYFNKMNDRKYLELLYRARMEKKLNLDYPKSFNEKIQWLKLYDRKPEYTKMVDKCEVKKYVSNLIGEQYIIPTIGVWEKFEDICFDSLPNQFVLKCTHDSGGLVVCKNKAELNIEETKKRIERSLNHNYFYSGREWPYKDVNPRIIAEKYLEDTNTEELRDYKFFCFDGKVKAMFIASNRMEKDMETTFDFFDEDFNHLAIVNGHPNTNKVLDKPKCFDEMKQLACKLSKGIPHLRVDFYEVDGQIYFGELTFSHFSGMVPFEPEEWDEEFGKWIQLPYSD